MKNQHKKIILFIVLLAVSFITKAQITSTFDTDAEGWTALNAVAGEPVYLSTGGNPGGFIQASDGVSGATTFMVAPSKFLGNQIFSYGQFIRFDLKVALPSTVNGSGDVKIFGSGTSIVRNINAPLPGTTSWTTYSIQLDENQGWRIASTSGTIATKAQILQVLSAVTAIHIGVEYSTVTGITDKGNLDNVILEQRALLGAPSITSFSPASGKSGTSITINGSGFDSTPANNSVSFGVLAGTKAVVQSASTTQLTVVLPEGAVYGPITVTNTTTGLSGKSFTPFNPTFDDGGRIIPASFKNRFIISTIPIEGWFVGDFDGDGWEDFAVTNNNTEDVIDIYRNLGLGGSLSSASFASKVSIPAPQLGGSGTNGAGLWFADLDGDGKLDAITSNATSTISAAFVTLRNTSVPGSISFEAPEYWAGGSDETPINLVADLDGDGRPEIMGGEGAICGCVRTDFWFNQNISLPGDIEFGSARGIFNNSVISGFAGAGAGDLNGDGKNELVVTGTQGQSITVLQNTSNPGAPSFTNAFTITTNQYSGSARIVDVNLDGKNDIVYKVSGETGIHIRLNSNTSGNLAASDFASDIIITSDLNTGGGFNLTDVNGDGKVDIAASDTGDFGVYENSYSAGVFNTNAYIPAYQVQGTGGSSSSPVISDLNHDGKPDFVIAGASSITIIENKNVSAPRISVNTVSPLAAPVSATVTITGSDFSPVAEENNVYFGAVKAEVLSATAAQLTVKVPAGATYAPVSVRKGELTSRYRLPFTTKFAAGVNFDNTHFAPPVNFTLTNANFDIEVGDLNNDGKPDVFVEANGGFAFRNTHVTGAINTSSLLADDTLSVNSFINPRIEDFDGDGLLDVASVNGLAHRNISTSSEISFQPSIITGLGASNMDMADFNNDGKTDFAVTVDLTGAGDLVVRENRSNVGAFTTGTYGTFSGNIVYNKPAPTGGVVAEDFDGDGFADIATTNPLTDNISVYHNAGLLKVATTQFATRIDFAVGDNPGRIYKGDFDNDGKVDLLVYHSTGTTTTLLTLFQNTSTPGSISFSRIDLTNPTATTVAAIADLDGDGKVEIITTSETGNRFSIFRNIHTSGALSVSSFATAFNTTVTAPRGLAIGDLNLDGKPEIIITRAAGLLVVYENLITDPVASISITQQPANLNNMCEGSNFIFSIDATGTNNITFQWQKFNTITNQFENLASNVVYSGVNTKNLNITNATKAASGDYRCMINGDFATTVYSNRGTLAVNTKPADPVVTSAERCGAGSITLSATGGALGEFIWRLDPVSGTPIQNENNPTYTISNLIVTTTYYVAVANSFCESNYVAVTATINTVPFAPTVTPASICGNGNVTLTASGGTNGQYRWYDVPNGGSEITGEVNNTYTTPSLTTTTTYYVSINNGKCESARTPVTATLLTAPTKPTITASETITAGIVALCFQPITLSAPAGFATYTWSSGQTTQQITTIQTGNFTVTVKNQNGCSSPASDVVQIVNSPSCVNKPPVINSTSAQTVIGGKVTINLSALISDPDGNLDPASLVIVGNGTQKGGSTTLSGFTLEIDYANVKFSGIDLVTIRVCDLLNVCFETAFQIEVIGDIVVYNGVSPNGDGKNDSWVIEYINLFADTQKNKVSIYNRWGDLVWEASDYDNTNVVFTGLNKNGNELSSGSYFYKIEFLGGRESITGYISLKR